MNIVETESPIRITAKTCGCNEGNFRKVTYSIVDTYHTLCLDKKDIIYFELEACEKLLKDATDDTDRKVIGDEILQLRMSLDLLP